MVHLDRCKRQGSAFGKSVGTTERERPSERAARRQRAGVSQGIGSLRQSLAGLALISFS